MVVVESPPADAGRRKEVRRGDVAQGSGLAVADGGEPGFFRALDLRDPAVVHDELDHAEAQALHFFTHEGDPIGRVVEGGSRQGGIGSGGGHDAEK